MTTSRSIYQHSALIIIFLIAAYYPSIFAPYNSIDDLRMVSSLLNADGFSLRGLFFPQTPGQYYRPLLYLTFLSDKYLWGLEASFMHLENILLHTGSALLIYFIVKQLLQNMRIDSLYPPLLASLLFGLHPIATEAVNWISGRTDLLAGFFVYASLLLFLQAGSARSRLPVYAGAALLLCGCLAKETALFILPVIVLWALFPPKDSCAEMPPDRRRLSVALFSAAGTAYLVMRYFALNGGDKILKTVDKVGTSMQKETAFGFYDVARVVAKTSGFYFKKLVLPLPLNFGIDQISPHYAWLGLLVIAGIFYCLHRRNTVSYLLLAAFMLTSSAFILPILRITWTPIAERYVYIAAAPFVMAVTLYYQSRLNRAVSQRMTTLFAAALLGSAALFTVQRNIIWQDNYTLFKDTMEKSPGFGAIVNEYALALRDRGLNDEADKIMLENRVDDFQQSSLNRIRVLTNTGYFMEARRLLLERIEKGAEYKQVLLELLVTIDESRKTITEDIKEKQDIDREILDTYQKLLVLTKDPFYHYKIGRIQLSFKDTKAAKSSFSKAWQGAPPNSHYGEAARKLSEKL